MQFHEMFEYDPQAGTLKWKVRPLAHFKNERGRNIFNLHYAGKEAGGKHYQNIGGKPGSVDVRIGSMKRPVHRIIWEMTYGPIPKGVQIDHANGNPFDNRLCNLRLATPSQNGMNRSRRSDNTSGYKGVTKHGNAWAARVAHHGGRKHLGLFNCPTSAYLAYCKVARELHGEFALLP